MSGLHARTARTRTSRTLLSEITKFSKTLVTRLLFHPKVLMSTTGAGGPTLKTSICPEKKDK